MRAYGIGYREVMDMPLRAFWVVSGFVERLIADEGKQTLEIQTSAQHPEAASEMMVRLEESAPQPVKLSARAIVEKTSVRDEAGIAALRASLM
jgi:hypothetical protein